MDDPDKLEAEIADLESRLRELEEKRKESEDKCSGLNEEYKSYKAECEGAERKRDSIKLNVDLSKVVVIEGLPKAPKSKFAKLKGFAMKKLRNKNLEKFELSVDADGSTVGCGFAFYKDAASAAAACRALSGFTFSKGYVFTTTLLSKVVEYERVLDVYTPKPKPVIKDRPNYLSWMMDEKVRDQFVMRFARETKIFWNDPAGHKTTSGRQLAYGGEREKAQKKVWTQSKVKWSPRGSYFATFHLKGIVLWGAQDFSQVGKYIHEDVARIDFSPKENFLVTCREARKHDEIIIWNIDTEKKLRSFAINPYIHWPVFRWSSDDKYVCRAWQDKISVYNVPNGVTLLDKKSMAIKGVQTAAFSPSNPFIATWVPESGGQPAYLQIIEIPSKKKIRERHFFHVKQKTKNKEDGLRLHWHPQGDFLCAQLCAQVSKKTEKYSFEFLRMRSKNIPVEVLEMDDLVVDVAWEPHGACIAIAHGDAKQGSPPRFHVSIYSLQGTKLKKIAVFEKRLCTKLFWAPYGRTLLLAGGLGDTGALEFLDINTKTSLAVRHHFRCQDVQWDPSGRYVITAVTQPYPQEVKDQDFRFAAMENGYKLWNNQGDELVSVNQKDFYQILWRPRPPSILPKKNIEEIVGNLKDGGYWSKFEKEDKKIRDSNLSGEAKEMRLMREEWKKYREERKREYREQAQEREAILGYPEEDKEDVSVEVVVENVLESKEVSVDPQEAEKYD